MPSNELLEINTLSISESKYMGGSKMLCEYNYSEKSGESLSCEFILEIRGNHSKYAKTEMKVI